MERTKVAKKELTANQIQTLTSAIVARAEFAAKLGVQYGGSRDLYQALGYEIDPKYKEYMTKYLRQDIAKAIIDRPVIATWRGKLILVESDKSEDTAFEEAWEKLDRTLGIKSRLSRADRLTGIGQYGILLLGLDDVKNTEQFALPTTPKRKLLYLKAFGEGSAKIKEYVSDPKNTRFGMPLYYEIEVSDISNGSSAFVKIHYSRVIHIVDSPLESEIIGIPRLQAVFNRLFDLEKIVGGDGEMFWRGARPGYHGKINENFTMTPEQEEALQDQIDEFEHNLRRILINEGIDLASLAQQIADPSTHVDVQLQMISAVTGIPKRILTGSERGELSSAQDSSEWKDYVQARREDYAELTLVRPLVDRLIELGVLPTPENDYDVKWSDLYSQSEQAQVELGKGRASALREYTYNPISQAIIPPEAFFEFCLGLSGEQITLIRKMRDDLISTEALGDLVLKAIDPPEPEPTIPAGTPVPAKKSVSIPKRTK